METASPIDDVSDLPGNAVYDQEGKKIGDVGEIYTQDGDPMWVVVQASTGMATSRNVFIPLARLKREDGKIYSLQHAAHQRFARGRGDRRALPGGRRAPACLLQRRGRRWRAANRQRGVLRVPRAQGRWPGEEARRAVHRLVSLMPHRITPTEAGRGTFGNSTKATFSAI